MRTRSSSLASLQGIPVKAIEPDKETVASQPQVSHLNPGKTPQPHPPTPAEVASIPLVSAPHTTPKHGKQEGHTFNLNKGKDRAPLTPRIPPMQFDEPIDFIMELPSTPHRPLMESSQLVMEVENAHLLMDAENPIAGTSAASSQQDPNPRIKRISIPRINISGLLEETCLEPLPQQTDEDAQHHSSSVSVLQAKITERMRSFGTSLIDMTRASHQRAVMRRALVSGDFPSGLTARIIPSMLKPNPEVLKEWELAHFAFSKRLAETLVHHYDLQIRKERDIQTYAQESIREAIENARLPDSDLEYIQRYWAEETEKASEEAKTLAKKQAAHREKVQENRKRRKVDSTPPSTEHTPTPASGNAENSTNLRAEIKQLREDLAKMAGNAGRGRGRGRGRGQRQESRSGSRDRVQKNPQGRGSRRPGKGAGRGYQ